MSQKTCIFNDNLNDCPITIFFWYTYYSVSRPLNGGFTLSPHKLRIFPNPLSFGAPTPMFHLEFRGKVNHEETRVVGLLCGESCVRDPIVYRLRSENEG